jgi:dTDP-4-amino-4,6-dideoxygalactose transaminase
VFPTRVPYCVPYWNRQTYHALARCLLSGHVVGGPDVARLGAELATLFGVPSVLPCATGKTALELALRALGLGPGDEVLVPTLCCPDVIAPVLAVGAAPVFTDVGPELNITPPIVEANLGPKTRAVIVPHMFGNPADVAAIAALGSGCGVAIVDDVAQALGGTLGGQPLGTFGSVGVGSFGNGKVCFGTGGGFVLAREPAVVERAGRVPLTTSSAGATLLRAAVIVVSRRWRRWSLFLKRFLGRSHRALVDTSLAYRRERMRNLDAAVARSLLGTLGDNLRGRRERVAWYRDLLADAPGVALVPHHPGSACTKQVVLLGSADESPPIERVISALDAAGYEVAPGYRPLHLSDAYRSFARSRLPWAEEIAGRLLELPTEPSVARTDIEQICALLRATTPSRRALA